MLLERDDIVAQLDSLAGKALGGCGSVVFVVGEAGIGKTSVLRATAERLADRLRLLWTACEDLSTVEALTLLRELPIVDGEAQDHATDRGSRLELFGETLDRLAQEPTVLLVEDLHWADDGSIDFVRYLGRRLADLPLMLIVSSRNEDQGARARLARAANDLPQTIRHRIDLDRLSPVAVGKLAAARGLIGSAIHEVTGGNPLLVAEVLAAGGKRSASIDDIVTSRADRLDGPARAFLDYCSILPRRVSYEQIDAADVPEAVIAACTETGLLLADGTGLAFRHEITRRAVEDALSPRRRVHLHRRELERLDRAGASAARRLHHAIGAGDRPRIGELAPSAAEQASRLGAHREAARAWAALLEDGEREGDPRHFERYAFELHVTGEMAPAIAWQQRALASHSSKGDALRQGDVLRFLSRLHYLNGEFVQATERGSQAAAVLAGHPSTPELALAYANLAHLAMLADDAAEALRWSEPAMAIARQLGRDDILATVLNNLGTAIQYREFDRGLALLDQSIALGRRSGSEEHVARAYTNKGWSLMQARHLEQAVAVQDEGIEYCRERDLETWADYMRGGQALTLLDLGRWDEAGRLARSVVVDRGNTYLMRNPAVRALALLRIRRGDEDPEPLVSELRAHMGKGREPPRFVGMALIVAERAWTNDGLAQDAPGNRDALALLDAAAGLMRSDGSPWDRGALWFWQTRLGASVPAPSGLTGCYALLAAGDIAGAASACRAQAMPFDEAMMLIGGDAEQAATGLAILDRLGARATATRARAELGARGLRRGTRGPRVSTRANDFGLTRRELEVLTAIDKGWTNKEIGERLFVSAKTVDHHVSAILGKVDARTRGEAAAVARSHGLID